MCFTCASLGFPRRSSTVLLRYISAGILGRRLRISLHAALQLQGSGGSSVAADRGTGRSQDTKALQVQMEL